MATSNIERYLESFAKQVVKDAKKNLASSKGDTELAKTIRYKTVSTAQGIQVQFLMEQYGDFVDKGVKGKGGDIPNGKYKGKHGGRRWFINWQGKRQDSPFQFGTGSGPKGGLTRGLDKWIIKKGIAPRDSKGKFMSRKSIKFLMARAIYIRGIHGISFFQNSLRKNYSDFAIGFLAGLKEDIITSITVNKSDI